RELMNPSSYFFYTLFKVEQNRNINTAISVLVVVVLAFVMVSLGCTMTLSKIMEHARKPKGVIIALVAQFLIMPASAFGLTQAFQLDTYAAIAVLICGCCPGGNLSNMLAYSLSGDMDLSILMTTCSSVIGLGMMPLSIYLYSQLITPLSASMVPFDKIVINILLTVLPVGAGIIIRHYRPQWTRNIMRFGGLMLLLCSISVAVLAGIMLGDAFFRFFDASVIACCAILPMSGYLLGYLFALLFRENPKCRRTICVETGCQNVQLCSTVLKLAFDPIIVGVLFLLPLVYMAFQVAEAFLIIFVFRVYAWCRGDKVKE
uniref:Solute carrier family 10 member 1 n=1 Tax=Ciona savignyi TaxID=51511 RepID=H2Y8C1_CIOSA